MNKRFPRSGDGRGASARALPPERADQRARRIAAPHRRAAWRRDRDRIFNCPRGLRFWRSIASGCYFAALLIAGPLVLAVEHFAARKTARSPKLKGGRA